MTTKTVTTLTDEKIEALLYHAGEAGDPDQVRICERALTGSQRARRECARVIQAGKAMGSEYSRKN